MEKALIAQMVSAVEPQYLAAVCNQQTGRYSSNFPAILQHLFTTYGHITPQQLKTREIEICCMHFHMALTVDAIFNTIDELTDLAEYELTPMSSTQAVSLAYVVFSKNTILLQDLRCWNHQAAEHHAWENMKVHLREAQVPVVSSHGIADLPPSKSHSVQRSKQQHAIYFDPQLPTPTDAS